MKIISIDLYDNTEEICKVIEEVCKEFYNTAPVKTYPYKSQIVYYPKCHSLVNKIFGNPLQDIRIKIIRKGYINNSVRIENNEKMIKKYGSTNWRCAIARNEYEHLYKALIKKFNKVGGIKYEIS